MQVHGSSPHERGTHAIPKSPDAYRRFIPARAGNTSNGYPVWDGTTVHPRTSGEHMNNRICIGCLVGSSPHERGTRTGSPSSTYPRRFIPARAGNTSPPSLFPLGPSVHPRTSGEHVLHFKDVSIDCGSSPHERGTRVFCVFLLRVGRFIPARAGNTRTESSAEFAASVHPRTSGEHQLRSFVCFDVYGSSPHERGTLALALAELTLLRFIPARAGNTTPYVSAVRQFTVHPRTSGEHPLPYVVHFW